MNVKNVVVKKTKIKYQSKIKCFIKGIYNDLIKRCKQKKWPNPDFDFKYIFNLYINNNICKYSGLKMTYKRGTNNSSEELNISIDRINNNLYYKKDNIQLVCWFINRMKYIYPTKVLLENIKLIYNYKNSNNKNIILNFEYKNEYNIFFKKMYSNILKRSKIKFNNEINFNWVYLKELFINQKGKCKLSGLRLGFKNKNYNFISIDRKNSKLPYIKKKYTIYMLFYKCW